MWANRYYLHYTNLVNGSKNGTILFLYMQATGQPFHIIIYIYRFNSKSEMSIPNVSMAFCTAGFCNIDQYQQILIYL